MAHKHPGALRHTRVEDLITERQKCGAVVAAYIESSGWNRGWRCACLKGIQGLELPVISKRAEAELINRLRAWLQEIQGGVGGLGG